MKIIVTGADGFTGKHLVPLLQADAQNQILQLAQTSDNTDIDALDLCDADAVAALIKAQQPDRIYHLAGSFSNDYAQDYAANVVTSKNILAAVAAINSTCRILLIGSAAEYGMVAATDNPVKESHQLNPMSVYGLTKTYQTLLFKYYYNALQLNVIMARTFNLFGAGMSQKLFAGRVYAQINKLKAGEIGEIQVGNLNAYRDFIHVDAAVRHYQRVMEYGEPGDIYNIGTGKAIQVRELLAKILGENALDMSVIRENVTSAQQQEVDTVYADISKFAALPVNSDR